MKNEYDELIEYISTFVMLNEEDVKTIKNSFELIKVKKNTLLEKENKTTNYLYFIISGYVRVYYIHDGEERTTQINCPSRFITSYQSFISESVAIDNVETITDSILLRINKIDLNTLNQTIKNWPTFSEKIYEQALSFNEERTRSMILLNAENRYKKLIEEFPDIIKNVPLQYISSYIGIKPESLSRIRRQANF